MKNVLTSFTLMFLLLITMSFSYKYLNNICDDLIDTNVKLEKIIEKENWKKGYEVSVDLYKKWDKEYSKLSVFIHHQNIDNINNELLQLTQFVKYKDKVQSLAKIHILKFYLKNILESEKINIQNIF
ncbi:DUF4363 family protein [Haloimpatiens sp. FM7315]|uniref:DUF4363 family protein n=1 Tax=Haloimpatiens sp. FM7315 TaxID=3298609 RepID=UPI003977A642